MSPFSRIRRASGPPANIRTLMGLWLYYMLRGDRKRASRLPADGTSQDPADEANQGAWAVMDSLFRLAVENRFKRCHSELDLDTFSAKVCEKWDWDGPVPSPGDLKELIREGLAGPPDTSQRDNMTMALSYLAVTREIAEGYDYGADNDRVVAQLVSSAEDVAIGWGFKPTMRKRKGWKAKLWQRFSGNSRSRSQ